MARVTVALIALLSCSLLVGPISAQPSPSKPMVYRKPGATNEDFQRTRAACNMRSEIAESSSTDPNALARVGTWATVYRMCMLAEGWVLVPQ